ncbi:MAG: NADH-quinone oxidoreductase subunit NuoB [Candidatus Omnitrophica bacterium]|nr:NADH-quinone oxidoreductase subunit NuoB [Candidatus Omnitrophota bacterium]
MLRILKKNFQSGRPAPSYCPGQTEAPLGFAGAPEIDAAKCTGCGQCVAACPTDALSVSDDQKENRRTLVLDYGDCIFCGLCGPACPYEAISFRGKFELAAPSRDALARPFEFRLSETVKDPRFVAPEKNFPPAAARARHPNYEQGDFADRLPLEDLGRKLKDKIGALFGRSLHVREVDAGSCNGCEVEITNLSTPLYDAERYGIHFVASPRHADLLLVTGPVTRQMELALVKTYAAMPSPKSVVACGGCAVSGGIFRGSYAVSGGVDQAVPVDVYIPGCPPRPEAILYGIFVALGKAGAPGN